MTKILVTHRATFLVVHLPKNWSFIVTKKLVIRQRSLSFAKILVNIRQNFGHSPKFWLLIRQKIGQRFAKGRTIFIKIKKFSHMIKRYMSFSKRVR